jgi:glycosyltransferase involved in cell wall biosynthesis
MSDGKLRVGIFLGYAPEQGIIDHGIGRLLGFLIAGAQSKRVSGLSVSIACPAWYIPQVRELLADLRISEAAVDLVTTDGIPYVLRLRELYRRVRRWRIRRLGFATRWGAAEGGIAFRLFESWLGTASTLSFLVQGFWLLLLGLLVLPVWLIVLLIRQVGALFGKAFVGVGKALPAVAKLTAYAASPLRELRRDKFAIRVYEAIRRQELLRLVRKINDSQIADVWYCPAIFWPEFAGIAGPKVVAVPDIVFIDFPLGYLTAQSEAVFRKAQEILRADTHLICYSDYVRDAHLVDRLGVDPGRISVIRHGLVDMQRFATGTSPSERRKWAVQAVNSYLRERYQDQPYLAGFDFSDVRFALFTSQARSHKNLLQLVRTWEVLLRKDYCGAKLVLTCRLIDEPTVYNYIQSRHLQFDVLDVSGVPSAILAALNMLAAISINPTLFEGGFPFTFSEAYSVGTPSIMSRIPAVLEMVRDPVLQGAMLFDPYDSQSINERVRWALANRSRLLELQRPLYDEMARRDWGVAASDYAELFAKLAASGSGAAP